MVRTPETASALDQICSGMKDKPGGGETGMLSLLGAVPGCPPACFPPAVSWGLLSGLWGTPFSGPLTLPTLSLCPLFLILFSLS